MHIYPWQIDPTPSSKQAYISGKPVHHISFICRGCYYPLHRGSSGTGPTAMDRRQNTITDVMMVFILDQGMILNSSQWE